MDRKTEWLYYNDMAADFGRRPLPLLVWLPLAVWWDFLRFLDDARRDPFFPLPLWRAVPWVLWNWRALRRGSF